MFKEESEVAQLGDVSSSSASMSSARIVHGTEPFVQSRYVPLKLSLLKNLPMFVSQEAIFVQVFKSVAFKNFAIG